MNGRENRTAEIIETTTILITRNLPERRMQSIWKTTGLAVKTIFSVALNMTAEMTQHSKLPQ